MSIIIELNQILQNITFKNSHAQSIYFTISINTYAPYKIKKLLHIPKINGGHHLVQIKGAALDDGHQILITNHKIKHKHWHAHHDEHASGPPDDGGP